MEEFRVDRPGTHLSGSQMGRGPPLLVMPVSWGMDSYIYTKGLSALQDTAQLIFFDPRGLGDSGKANEEADLSLATLVEDAEAVREQLGLQRWTIFGHSNGGYGALSYALQYPDRVERLILLDTAASREFEEEVVPAMRQHPAFPELTAAGLRVATEGTEEAFRAMMAAMFSMAVKDPERFRAANADLLEKMHFSPARLRYSQDDLKGYDVRMHLWEIRAPTLVITGLHDLIVPHTATEALAAGIKTSRLVTFEDSGHWPFVEERARFVKEIQMFLEPMRAAEEFLGALHEDEPAPVVASTEIAAEEPMAQEVETPEAMPPQEMAEPAEPTLEEEEIPDESPPGPESPPDIVMSPEPEMPPEPSEIAEIPGDDDDEEDDDDDEVEEGDEIFRPPAPEAEVPITPPESLPEVEASPAVIEEPSTEIVDFGTSLPEAEPDTGPSPPPRPSLEDFLRAESPTLTIEDVPEPAVEQEPEPPSPPLADPEPEPSMLEDEMEAEEAAEDEAGPAEEETPAEILQVVATPEIAPEVPDDTLLDMVERTPEEPPVLIRATPRRFPVSKLSKSAPLPHRSKAVKKHVPARKIMKRPVARTSRKVTVKPSHRRRAPVKKTIQPAKKAKTPARRQSARQIPKQITRRIPAKKHAIRAPRKSKPAARKTTRKPVGKKAKGSRRRR